MSYVTGFMRFPLLVSLLLLGCPAKIDEPQPTMAPRGPAGTSMGDAGGADDAGTKDADVVLGPTNLELSVVASFADGGTAPVGAESEIGAAIALSIAVPIKLNDFRIRLFDYREQVVPSDDELSGDGRTYLISLLEPLKTGRTYTLALDAELERMVTDDMGRPWNDWELVFRVAGQVQPEPMPRTRKQRNHSKKPLKGR